jgi:hypothetical protein
MRKLFLGLVVFFLSFSTLSQDQCGDYLELRICPLIAGEIKTVDMFIIVDDKLERVDDCRVEDGVLNVYLIPYGDYYFMINDDYDFTITPGYEIIDERDISFSANSQRPEFEDGILRVNFLSN